MLVRGLRALHTLSIVWESNRFTPQELRKHITAQLHTFSDATRVDVEYLLRALSECPDMSWVKIDRNIVIGSIQILALF